ncbi:MAG: HAMP domain-containing histidine kinase, partial [Calditrichales bacterium]|nr:HAMP domain-containing histidine kinase [Calditrichales bacterium]
DRQSNWQRAIRKMVHDIKNPLAGVQLKLQTIFFKLNDEYPDIVDSLKEEIETAYSEIKRIRNISKDFLKFNDLEILQPQKLQICELLKQCLGHFKAFQNDNMIMEIDCNNKLPDKVYWDKRQIEILMHILIENAIDAVKGKGKILLGVNLAQRLPDMKEEYVEIHVTDNGPGIPEDSRDKIFKPHFSTKTEGSGMGLVFARHIVQQHRGSIDFSTRQGSGAAFIIKLPVNILNLKTGD